MMNNNQNLHAKALNKCNIAHLVGTRTHTDCTSITLALTLSLGLRLARINCRLEDGNTLDQQAFHAFAAVIHDQLRQFISLFLNVFLEESWSFRSNG